MSRTLERPPTPTYLRSQGRAPGGVGHSTSLRPAALLALALAHVACSGGAPAPSPMPASKAPPAPAHEADDLGPLEPSAIEARHESWRKAREEAAPDAEASRALRSAAPGAEVVVFLGVWCPDSRHEVPRLWKAFEQAGGPLPFSVSYIGVGRDKRDPGGKAETAGLRYVPTVVVRRGGREVGRIVESAPDSIERALADLLSGARSGVISGRTDLGR